MYNIQRSKWQKDNQWFTKHYIENKDWATNDCAHEINKTRHFSTKPNQYHIDRTETIPHWQNRINTTSTEQNQYHIDRTESIPHPQRCGIDSVLSMWYWFCSVDVVLILFCQCGIDSVLSMWYWFCSVNVVLILFCRCGIDSVLSMWYWFCSVDVRTESISHRQNRINTTSTEQNQYHIDRTELIPHRQNRINTTLFYMYVL
jgi:hypothetical protein